MATPLLRLEIQEGLNDQSEALPPVLEDESERRRDMKRGTEEPSDEMECVYDVEVMDGLWTHGDVCGLVTHPCLIAEGFTSSIMFGSNPESEIVDFCGVKAKVWVPSEAVDDSTMGSLPGDRTNS